MKSNIDLLNGPIDSSLRKFAIPLALSFLVNIAYSWVDTYFVSRLGKEAIAAIGISEQLLFFIFTIGSGFAVGTSVVVSRRIGEGNKGLADHSATQSFLVMLLIAIVLAISLYLNIENILNLMNISGREKSLAIIYLSTVCFGIPGNFIIFQVSAVVRSSGNSVFPMKLLLFTTVMNAILAPLLIFGIGPFPAMGMAGAGVSTAAAQISGAIIALSSVFLNYTPVSFLKKSLKFDFDIIGKIIRIGLPATLMMFSVSLNRILLFSIANMFGTDVVATYTLGLKVDLFVFMSAFAVGAAIEITTSQNIGAGNISRVFSYQKSAVKQLSLIMLLLGLSVFFGGKYFAEIFTDNLSIIDKTSTYLKITAFSYVPFAIGIISTRVFSGAGDTVRSLLVVAIILIGIQLPTAYMLSNFTGLNHEGIWLGILFSHILFAFIGYMQLKSMNWLKVKV